MQRLNERTDIASRKAFPKEKLLRLVLLEGCIKPDVEGILPGRGAYLHKDKASLELALKRHAFVRAFHREPTEEEVAAILEVL